VGKISISFKTQVVEPTDSVLKLTSDPPTLDFGPIEEKKRRKLETKIKNTTEEEMELAVVSTPPGFFKKVELNRDKLKPGKEANLKVELERGKENETFRKTITLEARSEDNTKFRLSVPVVKGFGEGDTAKKDKK
jgi:hypothetical protein